MSFTTPAAPEYCSVVRLVPTTCTPTVPPE
jgi:hypothetical protein